MLGHGADGDTGGIDLDALQITDGAEIDEDKISQERSEDDNG